MGKSSVIKAARRAANKEAKLLKHAAEKTTKNTAREVMEKEVIEKVNREATSTANAASSWEDLGNGVTPKNTAREEMQNKVIEQVNREAASASASAWEGLGNSGTTPKIKEAVNVAPEVADAQAAQARQAALNEKFGDRRSGRNSRLSPEEITRSNKIADAQRKYKDSEMEDIIKKNIPKDKTRKHAKYTPTPKKESKIFNKSNVSTAVGIGVSGAIVFNMFNKGGQMSNSELYGQQQKY